MSLGGLIGILLATLLGGASTFEDVMGHQVAWERPPQRIVSLSPSITEILFAIGCDTTVVVGVTRFCNYPPEARTIARIGGIVDPNLEEIVALEPDLVLATRGNPIEFMESLTRLKVPVYALETREGLEQVLRTIEEIGAVTGREGAARREVEHLREGLAQVRARSAARTGPRPRVFYGYGGLEGPHWTAGPGSYVHDLITAAGGVNVGGRAPSAWSTLSLETIVEADPQVYLGTFASEGEEAARRRVLRQLREHEGWSQTALARNPRIILFAEDRLQRPGPRLFSVLEELSRALGGE